MCWYIRKLCYHCYASEDEDRRLSQLREALTTPIPPTTSTSTSTPTPCLISSSSSSPPSLPTLSLSHIYSNLIPCGEPLTPSGICTYTGTVAELGHCSPPTPTPSSTSHPLLGAMTLAHGAVTSPTGTVSPESLAQGDHRMTHPVFWVHRLCQSCREKGEAADAVWEGLCRREGAGRASGRWEVWRRDGVGKWRLVRAKEG